MILGNTPASRVRTARLQLKSISFLSQARFSRPSSLINLAPPICTHRAVSSTQPLNQSVTYTARCQALCLNHRMTARSSNTCSMRTKSNTHPFSWTSVSDSLYSDMVSGVSYQHSLRDCFFVLLILQHMSLPRRNRREEAYGLVYIF